MPPTKDFMLLGNQYYIQWLNIFDNIKGTATPYSAAVPLFAVKLHQFSDES